MDHSGSADYSARTCRHGKPWNARCEGCLRHIELVQVLQSRQAEKDRTEAFASRLFLFLLLVIVLVGLVAMARWGSGVPSWPGGA